MTTRLLLVEARGDDLIPATYAKSIRGQGRTIWKELEATDRDFYEYEELRIALEDKLQEIKEKAEEYED